MELLAGLLGRETVLLPNGQDMSMSALQNWRDREWSVKVAISAEDAGPGDNKHAVDIVGFKQNPDGCGLLITVHDKDLGATVTMPAEDLQSRLANWPVMLHREQEGVKIPKNLMS